jgi:hypothetical protein
VRRRPQSERGAEPAHASKLGQYLSRPMRFLASLAASTAAAAAMKVRLPSGKARRLFCAQHGAAKRPYDRSVGPGFWMAPGAGAFASKLAGWLSQLHHGGTPVGNTQGPVGARPSLDVGLGLYEWPLWHPAALK